MARTYILDVSMVADNTAPYATEPVTVEELRQYLQLEGTAYDTTLLIFIKAARKKIEGYCNASLVPKSIMATFETHGGGRVNLPYPEVDAIQTVEETGCCSGWVALPAADYCLLDGEGIRLPGTGDYKVTYTTKAPEDLDLWRMAIMSQAGHMYTHRDDATGWSAEAKALLEECRNINF